MRGGIGDYTARLVRALERIDWKPFVLTSAAAGPTEDQRVLARIRRWDWSAATVIQGAIDETGADIVHIEYQTGAFALHPAVNFLPRRLRSSGLPVVTTFHDLLVPYLFPKAGPLRRWANRMLATGSTAVIATNERDRRQLAGLRAMASRTVLIPIGSNLPPVPVAERAPREEPSTIGFFGFLTEEKGVDLLIEALERQAEPRPRLVIIGGGLGDSDMANRAYLDRLRERLDGADLQISETGHLSPMDAGKALTGLDLVVLPFRGGASLRSGTLIAALRTGLPVLTTDPGEGDSLAPFAGGDSVWLVPPGNVNALAEAIGLLIETPSLRARLGERARAVSASFTWDSIAERHADLYEQLLSESRGAARGTF